MLIKEMKWYDSYFWWGDVDCSVNLLSGNKKGGLFNVVEKVLGLVVKLGISFIFGVFGSGERVK